MRMQSIMLLTFLLLCGSEAAAKLIARRSTYNNRVDRSPYHHAYGSYTHPEPCCPWRNDAMPNNRADAVSEAQSLRESLWDNLDSATYQDDWQWKERRIREIETRLGHIVDWQR